MTEKKSPYDHMMDDTREWMGQDLQPLCAAMGLAKVEVPDVPFSPEQLRLMRKESYESGHMGSYLRWIPAGVTLARQIGKTMALNRAAGLLSDANFSEVDAPSKAGWAMWIPYPMPNTNQQTIDRQDDFFKRYRKLLQLSDYEEVSAGSIGVLAFLVTLEHRNSQRLRPGIDGEGKRVKAEDVPRIDKAPRTKLCWPYGQELIFMSDTVVNGQQLGLRVSVNGLQLRQELVRTPLGEKTDDGMAPLVFRRV